MSDFEHLRIEGYSTSLPYSTFGRGNTRIRQIGNRRGHGERIANAFTSAVDEFYEKFDDTEFVYLEFESGSNFELDLNRFENVAGDIKLSTSKEVQLEDEDGVISTTYFVIVAINTTAIPKFLEKINQYIEEDTATGKPRHQSLVANIEDIRMATLRSFWQESEEEFPAEGEEVWWEVWLNNEDLAIESLEELELIQGLRVLKFPEHIVKLVKSTPDELGDKLLNLNCLSEIRRPVTTADYFTYLDSHWEIAFVNDLKERIQNNIEENNISVCLLDTGVNIGNPLLNDLIQEEYLEAISPEWSKSDHVRHGHGTPMAGLILFGDLTDSLSSSQDVIVTTRIESVKVIDRSQNAPELYGQITLEAVALGEVMNPDNKRIVCMAISAPENNHSGIPSSWSAAIDIKLFGTHAQKNDNTLFIVSSGNMSLESRQEYPLSNDDYSVQDPAQSLNSITVGSFTEKDHLDQEEFPNSQLLAQKGQMSPANTTSLTWQKGWARKPDVVFEGGNDAIQNSALCDPDSLKLLSTGVGGVGGHWLTCFGDTSASAALASKFSSELYSKYPNYWPETIRGLIIHSAEWTDAMLDNRSISNLTPLEKKELLGRVGYGVPNLSSAMYSAENSLTMVAERTLKPFKYEESRVKTNEFHLFDLPWPAEVLAEMAEVIVNVKLTLSYFIEPNPGNKRYSNSSSYKSHGLRFKMIDRNESEDRFKARVSKAIRDEQEDYVSEGSENWILKSEIRDKGSIHKDYWNGTAADLALRNKIAIYPVGGWWKTRKKLERYNSEVNYSLIVSIETDSINNDLYNPVLAQIQVPISIDIDIS